MKRSGLWLALIIGAACAWKGLIVAANAVPFNGDEAIVALMARHTLQGNPPIFFYGQSYMGSLDALLVAAGFAVFGQQVWVIRLVQIVLYAIFLFTTAQIGREVFGDLRVGVIAAAILAAPTVNMTLYTTMTLGGYGELLILGNMLLILSARLARKMSALELFFWGLVAGLGVWVHYMMLAFIAPGFLIWAWGLWKRAAKRQILGGLGAMALGALIGMLPLLVFALQNGAATLWNELLGSAVAVEKTPWLVQSASHLLNLLLLGIPVLLGFRPPWAVTWLALPIIPVVFMAWTLNLAALVKSLRKNRQARQQFWLLGGIGACIFGAFIFTSFGIDPSGRYFLALSMPLAVAAAYVAIHADLPKWLRFLLPAIVIMYQFAGNLQVLFTNPPGFTSQFYEPTIVDHRYDDELIAFLLENGETCGYTTYWVAYPLAFQSGEALIYTPRLPYHLDLRYTARDNRYHPYNAVVEACVHPAYITARNPVLDALIVDALTKKGIGYETRQFGDYLLYYDLTGNIHPEEMGIKASNP